MQMRIVEPVGITHRRNFLAPAHQLAAGNKNLLQVPVQRIDVFDLSVFTIAVPDNEHVPPAHVTIARKNDDALADAVNRIAEISVAAADPVPIFTEMAVGPKSTRLVITDRIRFTDREIKTIGEFGEGRLQRRPQKESAFLRFQRQVRFRLCRRAFDSR